MDNLCTFLIKDPKKYILSPAALKITIMSRGYLITEASTGGGKGGHGPPRADFGGALPPPPNISRLRNDKAKS